MSKENPNRKVYPTTPRVNRALRLAWVADDAIAEFEKDTMGLSNKQVEELLYRLNLAPGHHLATKQSLLLLIKARLIVVKGATGQ